MCVFLLEPCVLVSLDWVEPMMIFLLHVTWSCIFHAYVLFFSLFGISVDWCFSTCLSLFLYFFLSQIVCAWHPSANPLRPGTLFVPGNHLLLTLLRSMLGSVLRRPIRTSRRTSPNVAFIWNATLSYWTSSILIYWLSFTGEDGSLFVRSQWVVPLWSYRNFTPICMDLIIPSLISLLLFEVSV